MDRSHVCSGDTWVIFLKSGFINGGCCATLKNYDRAANRVTISRIKDCEMHEQRVHVSREFGAQRKMLNGFVIVIGEGDDGERSG